ncbi:MAG: recombinase RecT [Lachnospiraceae bacterium]
MADVKQELASRAERASSTEIKLTKNMSIVEMVKILEPEIKKALPTVLTPERFTRMALSAINNTPKLAECSPMSFIAALMNAAQLGLEPNTVLGQAYLIPYKNKGRLECQFQIGYKGMIDLAYRSGQVQMIQAQAVYENDGFEYELGLHPRLIHQPAISNRGANVYFYAVFHTINGGYNFSIMSRGEMELFAASYSKAYTSEYSPWKTSFEEMGKKTVLKQALKYAPLKADFQRAVSMDETIKTELSVDMSEVQSQIVIEEKEDAA